jgi:hypothetical protein
MPSSILWKTWLCDAPWCLPGLRICIRGVTTSKYLTKGCDRTPHQIVLNKKPPDRIQTFIPNPYRHFVKVEHARHAISHAAYPISFLMLLIFIFITTVLSNMIWFCIDMVKTFLHVMSPLLVKQLLANGTWNGPWISGPISPPPLDLLLPPTFSEAKDFTPALFAILAATVGHCQESNTQ